MTVLALILAFGALLCFCLAAGRAAAKVQWVPLGLAVLTAAWIVQLLGVTHHLHVH